MKVIVHVIFKMNMRTLQDVCDDFCYTWMSVMTIQNTRDRDVNMYRV